MYIFNKHKSNYVRFSNIVGVNEPCLKCLSIYKIFLNLLFKISFGNGVPSTPNSKIIMDSVDTLNEMKIIIEYFLQLTFFVYFRNEMYQHIFLKIHIRQVCQTESTSKINKLHFACPSRNLDCGPSVFSSMINDHI